MDNLPDNLAYVFGDFSDEEFQIMHTLAMGLVWSAETRACVRGLAEGLAAHFAGLAPEHQATPAEKETLL